MTGPASGRPREQPDKQHDKQHDQQPDQRPSQRPSQQPDDLDRDTVPVLPQTSRDERDEGWGDEPGRRDDEWYRRERPPHHE